MIGAMRTLGLDYLIQKMAQEEIPKDPENWYRGFRENSPEKLFPFLVEDSGKIEKVYILEYKNIGKIENEETNEIVHMSVEDTTAGVNGDSLSFKLPFMKPSGSQSPQVGPVIKRTYDKNKGAGPTDKILNTTINYFKEIAKAEQPWSSYFSDIVNVLSCPKIKLIDGTIIDWEKEGYVSLLACAVDKIGPQKNTVFLAVKDNQGRLPGEQLVYIDYLLSEKLAGERYVTGDAPAKGNMLCPLCSTNDVTLYPNALKGAGINLSNADRAGVFPGIDSAQAWKKYGLCGLCADLLYIYKNHVMKKGGPNKDRQPFSAKIAGDTALIIPSFLPGISAEVRQEVLGIAQNYIKNMKTDVAADEDELLENLKDEKSILNFVFIWATAGQNIENITGTINNVLPSRLRELSELNALTNDWSHPLFPKVLLREGEFNFRPDLSLKALRPLFYRPGGKKAAQINKSRQLSEMKRLIASCVYHKVNIPEERFWAEVLTTARWYWLEVLDKGDAYGLINEGFGKKGPFLTAAGWIKNINWWIYYFKRLGVMKMEMELYEPNMNELKPFFGAESGIDSAQKAYAFLLGVLYGKVLQVQGARKVNVNANALTWLKRLTLKGKDLPELYIKIREKLLAYGVEGNDDVRRLLTEISILGVKLGDEIRLNEIQANYYLLLGQSLTVSILPTNEQKSKEGKK